MTNFGSSATLAQQITQGAPADVFAAASPATMETVADAAWPATQTVFVKNKLEIAVPPDNPAKVDNPGDLTDPKVKVALRAEQVPCGAAAVKAARRGRAEGHPGHAGAGRQGHPSPKVELGEVDAALVYRTDVIAAAGKVTGIPFPEADQADQRLPDRALAKAPAPTLARAVRRPRALVQQGKDVPDEAGLTPTEKTEPLPNSECNLIGCSSSSANRHTILSPSPSPFFVHGSRPPHDRILEDAPAMFL